MSTQLQDGGLLFNGLNLMMTAPDPTYGYRIRVMVHNGSGTEFGDPEAVISNVQSQLQDGDLQRVDRFGNRTATLDLRIDAPGSATPGAAVAYGQQALELAAGFDGWAELAWTSPMGGAETSVMEMTSAVVGKTLDLSREQGDGTRLVKVTIGARPHVRPTTRDTFAAPATVGSTTTTVDTGSATTGWSMLSTAPAAVHNLCPNPSFEANTTGWAAGSGTSSIQRTTSSAVLGPYVGSGALMVTFSNNGTPTWGYANAPTVPVAAGQVYTVGAAFGMPGPPYNSTPKAVQAIYRWFNASNAQVGSDTVVSLGGSGVGGYAYKTFTTAAAPAGAVKLGLYFGAYSPVNSNDYWFLDAVVVADAGSLGFFDGNTTDTTAVTYAWDGTVNNSTSTATWTAPTLAVVSGQVTGTVYGRATAQIRRNNTGITAAAMTTLQYMRIRGTATAAADGQITIADNGTTVTPDSYSYNTTTGAYEILLKRPGGFTTLDVTFTRTSGTISTTSGLAVAVDQIDITDNPYSSGKVQTRQISIGGSQRTELSLSVLGLDAAGTTPVGLGEQALIHTAAKGTDGRAKFLDTRAAAPPAGSTADSTAVSGAYNTLSTTGTPLNFTFAASTLLPGNYLVVARLMPTTTGNKVISFRGYVDPSTGDNVYDPPGGTAWKTTPLTVATTGYPAIAQNAWAMLPLGLLRLPPADLQDNAATITIQVAADVASAVRLDDVFLLNADVGQATLVSTSISGGSYSAVRLDAAAVDNGGFASVWVGVANGSMLADPTRLQAFEQHQAAPGFLQVSTITPACSTSRLSGSLYRRNGHDVAAPVQVA